MKIRKLRIWVKPTILIVSLAIIGIGLSYVAISDGGSNLSNNYTINTIIDDTKPVIDNIDNNIYKPYNDEKVTISKHYYNKEDDEKKQQNSLIFYENIYVQNTGILYSSESTFDILSVADGTVKNVKEDKILGTIIEIENNSFLTTIYQSVSNVLIKPGDTITRGEKIAESGNNKLSTEKDNCLLFQAYINGNIVNPESIYGMDINEINDKN